MIRLGEPRFAYGELDSTMDVLAEFARNGAAEGSTVVAASQRVGRGRAGRTWQTRPGTALLCSVLLRPLLAPHQLGALPLIAGVAIAEGIESIVGVRCQLKWPNDIFIGDRKVCGILAQTRTQGNRTEFVNLGFGINVSSTADELPTSATSLSMAAGKAIRLSDVESRVFERLSDRYASYLAADGEPSLDDWLARAMLLGESIEVENNGAIDRGRFVGVTRQGALVIESEAGRKVIVAGDLTRGPRTTHS